MKKKSAGDINHNFTHVYQKQQLHEAQFLRYGVRQTDFGPFFHFYNLTTHKIKNLKKGKKHLEILSFYMCIPKCTLICMLPEVCSVILLFVILGRFLPFYPTNYPEN